MPTLTDSRATSLSFIMCPSYHGATVLALLLNNHSELVCLGDTLPPRQYDATCACELKVSECEFWRKIGIETEADRFDGYDRLLPWYPVICGNKVCNSLLNRLLQKAMMIGFPASVGIGLIRRKARSFTQLCQSFSDIVLKQSGAKIFIDSKKPFISVIAEGVVLKDAGIRIIHLVRDPRGFVYSSLKHKKDLSLDLLCRSWVGYHRNVEKLSKVLDGIEILSLRHEDLCTDGRKSMNRVFDFLGVEPEDVFFAPANPRKHHLIGNMGTLKNFTGEIKCDPKWKSALSESDQRNILELTSPLSTKHGYSL